MSNETDNTLADEKFKPGIQKYAARFHLRFLDPMAEAFTFQVYDDDKERSKQSKIKNRGYDPRAQTIVGTLDDRWAKLVAANADGCAVHVTINRTVGARRMAKDVDLVRAHFVEIDEGSTLEDILAKPFKPAWINQSSPGKFHVYFRIAPDVASDLAGFTRRQAQLATLYGGGRESKDLPRVLRLAGFLHQKNPADPFLVSRVHSDKDAPFYTIAEFEALLGDIDVPDVIAGERADVPAAPEDDAAVAVVTEYFQNEATPAIADTPTGKAGTKGNDTTYRVMCRARDEGVEQSTCLDLALTYYNPRCEPEWSLEELQAIVANAYGYGQNTQGVKSAAAEFAGLPDDDFEPMAKPEVIERERTEREETKAAAIVEPDDFEYGARPSINLTNLGADLPRVSRKVQKRFIKTVAKADANAADQVFDMLGVLVHLSRNRLEPGTEGKFDKSFHVEDDLMTRAAEPEWFADTLERLFMFFKQIMDKKTKKLSDPIACGAPKMLVNRLFAIVQDWNYPKLVGTVETPTLRLDGTILDKPGYDKKSGLYFDPGKMTFPPIKENPTKADALAALDILKKPLVDFPFADEDGVEGLSLSVALAMLLTALCRRSLPTAPMFGIDAHEANTGKTELAQVAARLMTGHDTAARPFPEPGYQMQNALAAAFEAGDAVMLYDNIDGDKQAVEGDALCAALTSEFYECRRLGGNSAADQVRARTNSLMIGTGNKLTFAGDMSKDRGLLCNLRADKTLAERKFSHWPLDKYVTDMRAALVSAGLTILRAYRIAPDKKAGPNFRFEQWRDIVADALVWLGLPDPVLATERAKADDPKEEAQRDVMRAWAKYIGTEEVSTTEAMNRPDVLKAIAEARSTPEHKLSKKSAADYLKGMIGIKLVGYKLAKRTDRTDVTRWHAACVDEAALVEVEAPQMADDAAQEEQDFGFTDDVDSLM